MIDNVPQESERLSNRIIPEDKLKEMLYNGFITKERYESALAESREASERKAVVDGMISDVSYPFERTIEDIEEDHRRRLIDDRMYHMSLWYKQNMTENRKSGTLKSFKLKLSTAGLRIMGRYDLCEYSMRKDSAEMTLVPCLRS